MTRAHQRSEFFKMESSYDENPVLQMDLCISELLMSMENWKERMEKLFSRMVSFLNENFRVESWYNEKYRIRNGI